ncbi:MAG TPA: endonuclease/exonuclease/phosphatase family protein [Steroidobacteraceae bacterium]|nr:endonuclease/exonuclease/phosphatase family protein [Steroidobacteraceae bacterium]
MSLRRPFNHHGVVRVGQAAVAVAAVATLAGFAGGLWWLFDLFSHFRPQYLVGGLTLAVVLALAKRPRWAVGALAIAAINAIPVVSLYVQPAEAAHPAATGTLRLMSFNLFAYNREHARTLRYLQRELPDVLLLIEVTPEWVPVVRELAKQYPYRWVNVGDAASGIAMMSRERPSAAATIELPQRGVPAYLLTFERGHSTLAVLGAHLSWPLGRRESELRNAQLDAIAEVARRHTGPLVVLGDFNVTPFSPHFSSTLRDGGLRRCAAGSGFTPTWPARVVPLYIQIDHCLASAGVQAWNFRVGEYLGSDHYPISVEVAPAEPSPPISPR